jgi:hypothetical protein
MMAQHASRYLSTGPLNMTDELKKRRGLTLYKNNPFLVGTVLAPKIRRITNQKGDMMLVHGSTGEVMSEVAGFWHTKEVDNSKFVKLYVNGVKAFKELTGAGTKVFEVLYLEVQKLVSQDKVYMSFGLVNQEENPMSSATYDRGMRELVSKGFIAPTNLVGWFWLNPDYMWNGDRLAFVKAYFRKK